MKARYFTPLAGFIVPSLLIGFGVVIPGSCIAGVNNLTVGFASSLVGAAVAYWLGIRAVLSDRAAATRRDRSSQRRVLAYRGANSAKRRNAGASSRL
jgi:hypothetical protein